MNIDNFFAANSIVWPITLVLLALIVLRGVEKRMGPIFDSMIGGVAKSAQSNATAYAIALMFGIVASGAAFVDVFSQLDQKTFAEISWHQYLALWVKAIVPFVSAILAYATQNKFTGGGIGGTKPPFPPPTTQ